MPNPFDDKSPRGRAARSVEDQKWYKDLRFDYPSNDECWIWDRSSQQVNAGAFWIDPGVKVSVRPYLYACLLRQPYSTDGLWPSEDCDSRCVNPYHMKPYKPGPKSVARHGVATGESVVWEYLDLLTRCAWFYCDPGNTGYQKPKEVVKVLATEGSRPFPFVKRHWGSVLPVVELMMINGEMLGGAAGGVDEEHVWAVSERSGLLVRLDSVPRGVAVPEGYPQS